MLRVTEDKAQEKGKTNIVLLQEYIENLSIKNNSIDFVMASLVLHELSSLKNSLEKIYGVLKTMGHLLCLEYEKDELIVDGPPMAIRIASGDIEKALLSIGFSIIEKTEINQGIYNFSS